MRIYQIKYSLFDSNKKIVKWGEIKVKNKDNELAAKVSLEKYLRTKYKFHNMVVHECKRNYYEEMQKGSNPITDLFGKFK
ncbi:hypothetical protein RPMD05_66 [Rhodobacteraceae phage LS06-2018-MD05]|nr:hypothetical protein RPMD05_66 [Rhodobacteraceae phage LS06-2018-MD05]